MTKTSFKRFLLLAVAPLLVTVAAAQASHTTHTAAHHAAAETKPACTTELPAISDKIPALDKSLSACPKTLYALSYTDTEIGTGDVAKPHMWYTVHYTGYLADGTKFDSSVDRGDPITFPYGAHQVIPGWDSGFEGMHVGGKRRLYIPYQLAYGEAGRPPVIPAKAMLVFDLQFIAQSDKPPAPKTPPAVPQPVAPPAGTSAPVAPAKPAAPAATTPGATTEPQKSAPATATPAPVGGAPAGTATLPDTKKPPQ